MERTLGQIIDTSQTVTAVAYFALIFYRLGKDAATVGTDATEDQGYTEVKEDSMKAERG